MLRIVAFLGDGIGPEIGAVALAALAALDLELEVEVLPCGLTALASHGSTLPAASFEAARAADGVILGPLSTFDYPPPEQGGINASARLRSALDLFANLRPSKAYPCIAAARPGLDVVVVRENTEGFYAVRTLHAGSGEFAPDSDMAFALRKITAKASRRIADAAFRVARNRAGRRVTAVHKANVLKLSDGLFLRECRDVAAEYPDIAYDEALVDAVAAGLVRQDVDYDVIVTTNLFGDILSNQAAALAGGLGLGGSLNVGERHAVAQAVHGSAPDIAGTGIANPVSLLTATAMLLRQLGECHGRHDFAAGASALENAVVESLARADTRTRDVGGSASTRAVGAAICRRLQQVALPVKRTRGNLVGN